MSTFWGEVHTHISFPVRFYSTEEFGAERVETLLIHVLFAGLILLFLLFQVRFNPTVRGSMEVYLGVAIVAAGFYMFCFSGEANRLLWPDSIWLRNNAHYIFVMISEISVLLFVPHYLNIQDIYPRLTAAFRVYAGLVALMFLVLFLGIDNQAKSNLVSLSLILSHILVIVGIVQSLRIGRYWVLYLMASFLALTISITVLLAMFQGWLPYNYYTMNGPLLAFPIDTIAIAVSLIMRHRALKRERDQLRQKIDELASPAKRNEVHSRRMGKVDEEQILQEFGAYFQSEKPFLDDELSLADVARHLGLRADQLSALLNQRMNASFSTLINEYRIREAQAMMVDQPDMNLLEIAFACGFGSRASFNRVFKQHVGQPPQVYRRGLGVGPDAMSETVRE